jgi:phosphoribosylamine--glycine ligase
MEACVDGKLDTIDLQFEDNAAVCVVLASDGYPVSYEKGFPITGLEKFEGKDDYFCFHAGTKFDENGTIVTNGGHYGDRKRFKGGARKSIRGDRVD